MIELEEAQRRILAVLEEAGQEPLVAMLNTIIEPTGSPEEILVYKLGIEALADEGLITLKKSGQNIGDLVATKPADLEFWRTLSDRVTFDGADSYWRGPIGWAQQQPTIFVTDRGHAEAKRLLTVFGYRWWRQTKP